MFSSPMKTRRTPARAHFSMKFGSLWQSVSTWMMKLDIELLDLAQLDQPVEDRLPVLVAGEIVVGDEEAAQALRVVVAHDLLDVVGRAAARLAALDIDDGAERALIRAAAAGVEAGHAPAVRCTRSAAAAGSARPDARQIVHEVVERLERARGGIAQHLSSRPSASPANSETPIALARVDVGVVAVEHARRAGDVEAADARPGCRARAAAARCRARAETGSTARRPASPCRRRRPRSCAAMRSGGCACWFRRRRGSRSSTSSPSTRRSAQSWARP